MAENRLTPVSFCLRSLAASAHTWLLATSSTVPINSCFFITLFIMRLSIKGHAALGMARKLVKG
ncbi:hypothetical protein D3C75_1306900 [compost metagenome]